MKRGTHGSRRKQVQLKLAALRCSLSYWRAGTFSHWRTYAILSSTPQTTLLSPPVRPSVPTAEEHEARTTPRSGVERM